MDLPGLAEHRDARAVRLPLRENLRRRCHLLRHKGEEDRPVRVLAHAVAVLVVAALGGRQVDERLLELELPVALAAEQQKDRGVSSVR